MSTHNIKPAAPGAPRLSNGRLMAIIATAAVVLLTVILGITRMMEGRKGDRLMIPDETTVAVERLAEALTGPRYFQVAPGEAMDAAGVLTASSPAPHVSPVAARRQVDRVAKERNLTPETTVKIHKLIDRLTETPKSRAIGEEHVNLLRLNLALDELK